jgi:CRISPR-associated Csx2 family protein
MARVYLSFLGTSDYLPCNYCFNGKEIQSVRFVQEATIGLHCQDWSSEDRILIFTTSEALKKNWLNSGYGKNGEKQQREGLSQRLKELKLKASIKNVLIPEGKSEQEIWQIFEILYDSIKQDDEIIFDITHSFRSIPMLAIIVLNYAKVIKKIVLQGIYYGAFEILGSLKEAEKIPLPKRRVPIFDLTPFDNLLDWSLAIDRFLISGDADQAGCLAQQGVLPLVTESKGKHQAAVSIRSVGQSLQDFTRTITTCRGKKISTSVKGLKETINQSKHIDLIKPLRPLLDHTDRQMESFTGDEVRDGIQAVRWCWDHNLIQQGYTILREFSISFVLNLTQVEETNKDFRELVPQAVTIFNNKIIFERWFPSSKKNEDLTRKILSVLELYPEWAKIIDAVMQNRNDINHAGFVKNVKSAEKLKSDLIILLEKVEKIIIRTRKQKNNKSGAP